MGRLHFSQLRIMVRTRNRDQDTAHAQTLHRLSQLFFMEMNLAPLENIEKHILDLVYIQIFNRRRSSIIGYNNTN